MAKNIVCFIVLLKITCFTNAIVNDTKVIQTNFNLTNDNHKTNYIENTVSVNNNIETTDNVRSVSQRPNVKYFFSKFPKPRPTKPKLQSKQTDIFLPYNKFKRKDKDDDSFWLFDMVGGFIEFVIDIFDPPSKVEIHSKVNRPPKSSKPNYHRPGTKKKVIKKPSQATSENEIFSPESDEYENKLPESYETEEQYDDYDMFSLYNDDESEEGSNYYPSGNKKPQYVFESMEDEDYSDETGSYENYGNRNPYSGPTKWTMSSIFMDFVNEIYFRFAGDTLDDDDDEDDDEDDYGDYPFSYRKTTPNIYENRKPKKPTYNQFLGFFSEDESTTTPNKKAPKPESKWIFDSWFQDEEEAKTTSTTTEMITTTEEESGDWGIFNMFGGGRSTDSISSTTPKVIQTTPNPIPALISVLSDHLAQSTTEMTEVQITNPSSTKKSYKNYQLWRLKPVNEDQIVYLEELRKSTTDYQWWHGPSLEGKTDVVVPPDFTNDLHELLDIESIAYSVTNRDLQKAIQFSNPKMSRIEKFQLEAIQGHPLTWYHYHKYEDIIKFLEYIQRSHPRNVELLHIGRSFEGQPLVVCHVFSRNHSKSKIKKSMFIESGLMGNEWIGPAVSSWIINQFSKDGFKFSDISNTNTSWDFYILPIANPDGYDYTHDVDRLWMKNRSTKKHKIKGFFSNLFTFNWWNTAKKSNKTDTSDSCVGVNLNRNFDFNWNEDRKLDLKNYCSQDYSGDKEFSEPESKALAKYLLKQYKKFNMYISLRAYGQTISIPTSKSRRRKFDLLKMADNVLNTFKHRGSFSRYFVDEDSSMTYSNAGSSTSFMHNELGIKRSFTIKLRDTGENGFLLPPSYIETTAKETLELIKAFIANS